MRNVAIITARSGSKGIKNKNIRLLNGKPLLVYSIEAALGAGVFEKVMVSTDSKDYAALAEKNGAEVPFLRSAEKSGDETDSWDAVSEVLEQYKRRGCTFDTICLLQPTSPLRTSADIILAYEYFEKTSADAVTGVCKCDHPMEYMMTLCADMSLSEYRKREPNLPRQMLPTYYRINGAIFIRSIEYANGEIITKSDREYAYVMDVKRSVDIDTMDDFEYAEYLMGKMEKR